MLDLTKNMETNTCPLRVDPRILLKKRAKGDFKGAYNYYKAKVLFPEIISTACSRSCLGQKKNKKSNTLITNIEKACVETQPIKKERDYILQKSDKTIAVIGGGIAGAAAAVFLSNRGYEVHVYEKTTKLGGKLGEEIERKTLHRELYESVDEIGIYIFYERMIKDTGICYQYGAVCNTVIEEWKTIHTDNLFHAFGANIEFKIAASIEAGQQVIKYLNQWS